MSFEEYKCFVHYLDMLFLPNEDAWSESTVLRRIKCFPLGATSRDYGSARACETEIVV
jgi:hypothetical protein